MGFLNGLGRFLQGKPVFETEQKPSSGPMPPQPVEQSKPQQTPLVDERGYKNIPEITVDYLKARRSGDRATVTAYIKNHSDRQVRVDYFVVHGQKRVFQLELEPGKTTPRDVVLYEGPVAPNEHDSHAELVFRIMENGDLFKNEYHVEFNREADGKYVIEELHEDGPVRDI